MANTPSDTRPRRRRRGGSPPEPDVAPPTAWPTDLPDLGHPPNGQLAHPFGVGLWWSKPVGGAQTLLYGWAVPVTAAPTMWIDPKTKTGRALFGGGPWPAVSAFLGALREGETVGAASAAAGLGDVPDSLKDAVAVQPGDAFAVGTWTLHLTRWGAFQQARDGCPTSPSQEAPAVVQSLVRLDKRPLFEVLGRSKADEEAIDRGVAEEARRARLREALVSLGEAVGLDFVDRDVERLGNLEVLRPLGQLPGERPLAEAVTGTDALRVTVHRDLVPPGKSCRVRCRQEAAGRILRDETRQISPLDLRSGPVTLDFPPPASGTHTAQVEVWVGAGDHEALAWTHAVTAVRTISIGLDMQTATYHVGGEWLDKLERNTSLQPRIAKVKTVSRGSYSTVEVGVNGNDLLAEVAQTSRALRAEVLPEPSGARWFAKMRGDTDDRRLALVEWIHEVCQGAPEVWFADPYFDRWGLEIFARVPLRGVKLTVVTSRNDREDDPTIFEDLVRVFPQIRPLFQMPPRLVVAGTDPPLHDRYLLVRRAEGTAEGFHLSNSLQGAAKYSPLLVTPIPPDVLPQVRLHLADCVKDGEEIALAPGPATKASPETAPSGTIAGAAAAFAGATSDALGATWTHLANHLAHTTETPEALSTAWQSIEQWGVGVFVQHLQRLEVEVTPGPGDDGSTGMAEDFLRQPFQMAIGRRADHLVRSPFGRPWWLTMATDLLGDHAPEALVAWLDAEAAALPADGAAPRGRVAAVLLARVQMHLEHWTLHDEDAEREARRRSLAQRALTARTPALRALGAKAIAEPLSKVDDEVHTVLQDLADPVERAAATDEVIQRLIHWGRGDTGDPHAAALAATGRALASQAPDDARLDALLDRSATEGPWAERLATHVLQPVGDDVAHATFARWIVRRLEACVDEERRGFRSRTDTEPTRIAARSLVQLPVEARAPFLEGIEHAVKKARRTMAHPFARSVSYTAWHRAHVTMRWAGILARWVELEGTKVDGLDGGTTAATAKLRAAEAELIGPPTQPFFPNEMDDAEALGATVASAWHEGVGVSGWDAP